MEETRPKKKRRLWWLLLPAAVLVLAALAVVFFLGNSGLSARYDNGDAIRAAYDESYFPAVELLPDGTGELRLGKEDLYWLGEKLGISQEIREKLSEDKDVTDAGFRLADGTLTVYLGRREWKILPLSYRGEMSVRLEDGALILHPEGVRLGARMNPPERRWPMLFQQDLRLDLSAGGLAEEVTGIRLEGNTLVLSLRGITYPAEGLLLPDEDLAAAMELFGEASVFPPECRALVAGCEEALPAAVAQQFAADSGRAEETLSQVLALCEPDSVAALWKGRGTLVRNWEWKALIRDIEAVRSRAESFLSAEQSRYERLLFAVREMYRSGALGIDTMGFFNTVSREPVRADMLTNLPISPTDSRIVFLMAPEGSGELFLEDLPQVGTVKINDWFSLTKANILWSDVMDLGIVLTTESGVPVLLYRRGDGAMAIRELTEERFVDILVTQGIPRMDMNTLPAPGRVIERIPGEGWSRTVLLPLPKEE